jgi:hypothetical protein
MSALILAQADKSNVQALGRRTSWAVFIVNVLGRPTGLKAYSLGNRLDTGVG